MKRLLNSIITGFGYTANSFGAWIRYRFVKKPYLDLIKEKEENYKWFWLTFGATLMIAILSILAKTIFG